MQKKLQHSFHFFILMIGFLFVEGQSFAQNTESPETEKPQEQSEEIEQHETKDLEKLLKSYNRDQEKVLNDASKIHNIKNEESSSEISEDDIQEMSDPPPVVEKRKIIPKERLNPKDLSLSDSVRISLGPLQKLSEKELIKLLNDHTKESPARPYFDKFPNITLAAVRLIKDQESIPSLVKIVEDKDRMIRFAGWMLTTILLSFFLKRFFRREDGSFFRAVIFFFVRFYIMLIIRLAIIYTFFHVELRPSIEVLKKTFLS